MSRARFIADGDACTVFGVVFGQGEWTDVSALDPDYVARLAANPTFEFEPITVEADPDPTPAPDDAPVGGDADL